MYSFQAQNPSNLTVPGSIGSPRSGSCFHLPHPGFDDVHHRRTTNLVTAVVNTILSPFAVVTNFLIIFVICKKTSLHSPSNLLLGCLAIADILVGLIVQPSYVAYRLLENQHGFVPCSVRMLYSTGFYVCFGVSFMTLCAISCERLLTLLYPLRYQHIVYRGRVMKAAASIWFVNILLTFLQWAHNYTFRAIHLSVWIASFLIAVTTQCRILPIIRHHQRQIRQFNPKSFGTRQMQIKLAINIASIITIYFALNLPVLIITTYHQIVTGYLESYNFYSWAETVAFTNSSLNPLVCLWRVKTIRSAITGLTSGTKVSRTGVRKDNTSREIPIDDDIVLVRFRHITPQ